LASERRVTGTTRLKQYQCLSLDLALMCHERSTFRFTGASKLISRIWDGIRNEERHTARAPAISDQFHLAEMIPPCTLCSYEVDCADVVDLRTDVGCAVHRIKPSDMDCDWRAYIGNEREPPSWNLARRLISEGHAGILVRSFAPKTANADQNLVLWKWSDRPPHLVNVFDPNGGLPKNQSSWNECDLT
jgi:RES domain-containing protein